MPNLSQVLKSEIIRISRKEFKAAITPVKTSNQSLRLEISKLKKQVAELEKIKKQVIVKSNKVSAVTPEEVQKARFTSNTIKKLRRKLGISQDTLAKLMGISGNTVALMEKKTGRLKLRQKTLVSLILVRGMGKRDVQKKLEELKSI